MTVLYHHLPNVFRLIDFEEVAISDPNYIEFTEDAVGWDGVRMVVERDKDHGFKNETSDGEITLDFDLITGYQLIKKIYNTRGAESRIGFQYLNKDTEEVFFESEIYLYAKPSFESTILRCSLAKETFHQKFRTRQSTKYNLLSQENLDGGPYTPVNMLDVSLPNKEVLLNSSWIINPALAGPIRVLNLKTEANNQTRDVVVPWQIQNNEVPGSQSPVAGVFSPIDGASHGIILTGTENIDGRSFTLSGRLKFTIDILDANEAPQFSVTLMVVNPDDQQFTELVIGASVMQSTNGSQTFDFIFEDKVLQNVPLPHYIGFAIKFSDSGSLSGAIYDLNVNYDLSLSSLIATEVTEYPDSLSKVTKMHEALDKSIEQLTGLSGRLRSNFFGRTDINYGAKGPGADLVATTGQLIRKFPDAGLTTSWKQLFTDSLKPLYNLGMGFETETDLQGEKTTVIRVEDAPYFYKDDFVYQFQEVRNYREEVWDEIVYSEIEVGFKKFLEEEINTLDAVHTIHNYLTSIQRHENKLSIIISAIMDAYAIEFTRRQQYAEKPTTSWKYDDDLFFLHTTQGGGLSEPIEGIGYIGPGASFVLLGSTAGDLTFPGDVWTDNFQNLNFSHKVAITRFDKDGQPMTPIIGTPFGMSYDAGSDTTTVTITGSFNVNNQFGPTEAIAVFAHTQLPFDLQIETSAPFQSIEGIISPDTFPNLRHTPKSILLRYALQLKSGLYFEGDDARIKNTFVKHNGGLQTILKSTETVLNGRSTSQLVHEGGNLQVFQAGSAEGHFIPEKVFFDCTLHWEDFALIRENLYGLYRVDIGGGVIISGNLNRIEYNPSNPIEASVELLKRQ